MAGKPGDCRNGGRTNPAISPGWVVCKASWLLPSGRNRYSYRSGGQAFSLGVGDQCWPARGRRPSGIGHWWYNNRHGREWRMSSPLAWRRDGADAYPLPNWPWTLPSLAQFRLCNAWPPWPASGNKMPGPATQRIADGRQTQPLKRFILLTFDSHHSTLVGCLA